MSSLFTRLGLVATCLAFVACGSAPEPKDAADEDRTAKRKKKKKKRKTAEEREAEERAAEKVRAHQEDKERVAEARKSPFRNAGKSKPDDEPEPEEAEAEAEPEEPEPKPAKDGKAAKAGAPAKADKPVKLAKAEKPAKAEKASPVAVDDEPESDDVTIVEDEDVEPEPVKQTKAKLAKKSKPPKKVAKKAAPKPDDDEELAADLEDEEETPKRGRQEVASAKRDPELDAEAEPAFEEEPAPKVAARPKQKAVVAAKAKAKAKKAPAPKEEEAPEIEMEPEPDKPPPSTEEVIEMDTSEDDPLKERRVAAIAVPGVDDGSDEEDDEEPEPLPPGAWPLQINDRPLTLAKGKLAVHGGPRIASLTVRPPGGTPATTNTTSLALGATYGVGEKLEVGLDYALGVSPGSIKGPLTLHGAYLAVDKPKLEVAVAGGFAVDFADVTNAMMQTETVSSYAVVLGAWARYHVSRKASLFTGIPATPAGPVSLSKVAFPLPPLPYQIAFGLSAGTPRAIDVPFGGGYQLKPNVYLFGVLNLAHIRIANTENAFLFKDIIPLTLGGYYTRKAIDVGVQLSDDLRNGTDNLRFDVLVRYGIK